MSISKEDVARVKGLGFLRNRGTDLFSGRLVPEGSVFTADQLSAIAECARRYGSGKVAFTSRLSAEIVGIPYEKIDEARAYLNETTGLDFGGTGAKIRPVTACKGTTCVYGNFDTQALARRLHHEYYLGWRGVSLPHKFKIGVGGCPNSCMKPSLNDFGIEGHHLPEFDADQCRACKVCAVEAACPMKAVSRNEAGRASVNEDICKTCGVCRGKCPFGAFTKEGETLYQIYVGGTWGKTTRMGTPLPYLVREADILPVLEKTLLWYRENGYQKERLGAAIDRAGIEQMLSALEGDDLLNRRAEILALPIRTR